MDPFSLAVGIAGLVGLVGKTIKTSAVFVREAKCGQEAATELLKELDILAYNLQRLDDFLRTIDHLNKEFSDTSVLVSSTFACRTRLTILHEKLERAKKHRLGRLTWPLSAKDHYDTIETLRAYTQCCQFSLNISGCMLLTKTSTEVQANLRQQLDTFQLLEKIDVQAQLLERSLAEQTQAQRESHAAEERERVLKSISKSRPEERHHDVRSQRLHGTGGWLLEDRTFQRWRDDQLSPCSTLQCQGVQGAGKSVLA